MQVSLRLGAAMEDLLRFLIYGSAKLKRTNVNRKVGVSDCYTTQGVPAGGAQGVGRTIEPRGRILATVACRFAICTALFTLILQNGFRLALADDLEAVTIERMVDAGLVDAAFSYAAARYDLAADDPDVAARWVVMQMQLCAQAARNAASEAPGYRNKRQEILDTFVAQSPDNRRLPWLAWQAARCDYLHAQAELAAYLAAPADSTRRDEALSTLRDVVDQLRKLDQDITMRLQVAAREGFEGGRQAPAEQLLQLRVDAQLLECETMLLRSRAYPLASTDRIAAAGQLDVKAAEILSRTDNSWPSRPQLVVARAAAQLELGSAGTGLVQLQDMASQYAGGSLGTQAAQLAIDFLCRTGDTSRARGLLDLMDTASPLSDLAKIQIGLADAARAPAASKQAELAKVIAAARQVGSAHGDYWQNRADALLVGAVESETLTPDPRSPDAQTGDTALALVRLEAKQLIAAGKMELAIAKLKQRLDLDLKQANADLALEGASQIAALHYQTGNVIEAAQLLQSTAIQFAKAESAADLHKVSLAYLQNALIADIKNQELVASYEAALEAQLATWPDAAASEVPADWLTQWFVGQRRYAELLESLLMDSLVFEFNSAVAQSIWRWLTVFADAPDTIQREALADLIKTGSRQDSIKLAIRFSSLFVDWGEQATQASQMRELQLLASSVEASLANATQEVWPSQDWSQLAKAAAVLYSLRARDLESCKQAAADFRPTELPAAIMRFVAQRFVEAIDFVNPAQRAGWAEACKLDASLAGGMLDSTRVADQAVGYRIYAWAGQSELAVEGLRALLGKHPRDAAVMLQLAEYLAEDEGEAGDRRFSESTRLARIVVANTSPAAAAHTAAHWRRIDNLRLSGKVPEAVQAAKLFLATSPPADPIWQARFQSVVDGAR